MPPIPLTAPVFHILVALSEGERHGYAIMQDVAWQTGDALQLANEKDQQYAVVDNEAQRCRATLSRQPADTPKTNKRTQ